jgi:hypothetical protein
LVPGASLMKQNAKAVGGDGRDNLSASPSVGRAKLSRWRILELELEVEAGSSIVTRAHGCETAEREAGFAVSVEMPEPKRSHQVGVHVYEKSC